MTLKAPFPWFGGKRKVAPLVWRALGDVDQYVEPFAGSLATLLMRPAGHTGTVETVNDMDSYLVNFWRAVKHAPEEVAYHANDPVNESDLTARHIWLVNTGRERLLRLEGDPDYYDAKVAGWWVWGICSWIGSGWCSGKGPWGADEEGQLIHLGDAGRGVNRQRVHLGNAGQGVNRQLIHLGNAGQGVDTGLEAITAYMEALAARLRYVRVTVGDWTRVVTAGALTYGSTVGVFLDPPYDTDIRAGDLYVSDAEHGQVSTAVREWALANGDNPRYRIVLAGYEPEHIEYMPDSWRMVAWTANKSYGTANGSDSANDANRRLERLWLSPHCQHDEIPQAPRMLPLFAPSSNGHQETR